MPICGIDRESAGNHFEYFHVAYYGERRAELARRAGLTEPMSEV